MIIDEAITIDVEAPRGTDRSRLSRVEWDRAGGPGGYTSADHAF